MRLGILEDSGDWGLRCGGAWGDRLGSSCNCSGCTSCNGREVGSKGVSSSSDGALPVGFTGRDDDLDELSDKRGSEIMIAVNGPVDGKVSRSPAFRKLYLSLTQFFADILRVLKNDDLCQVKKKE
jgi:hypothetical protein